MFSFLKPYISLKGYLHRFTLIRIGAFHLRVHRILSEDKTPFLHTHPFCYFSLVMFGGYDELVESKTGELRLNRRRLGSIVFRSRKHAHQIIKVYPGTITLFFTIALKGWRWHFVRRGKPHPSWIEREKGVYLRVLQDSPRFCKFDQFWHKSADTLEKAKIEVLPSINQSSPCGPLIERL